MNANTSYLALYLLKMKSCLVIDIRWATWILYLNVFLYLGPNRHHFSDLIFKKLNWLCNLIGLINLSVTWSKHAMLGVHSTSKMMNAAVPPTCIILNTKAQLISGSKF